MTRLFQRRVDDSREILARLEDEGRQEGADVDWVGRQLSHRNVEVRSRAARVLGEIGKPPAIPLLQEALRQCYVRRSFGLHVLMGWVWTGVILIVCVTLFLIVCLITRSAPTSGYREFGEWLVDLRRRQDPFVHDCVEALERIAARDATPASRSIVPFLQGIAIDPLHHSAVTRAAAHTALRRIEARTAVIKSMPVAANAPQFEPDHLPVVNS